MWFLFLLLTVLFVLLTPGILLKLPPSEFFKFPKGYYKYAVAITHAIVFSIIVLLSRSIWLVHPSTRKASAKEVSKVM
jgi:hypothetical protein